MDDQQPEEPKVRKPTRASTMACMARIVRAFQACGQLTINGLEHKADVKRHTARRALTALLAEGLITQTNNIFTWSGK